LIVDTIQQARGNQKEEKKRGKKDREADKERIQKEEGEREEYSARREKVSLTSPRL